MKHSLFKSLRAELIFYVAVSMFLSVITEFACGVGLYILSTALGISYRGYGRSDMNIVGRKAGEHIPKTNFFTYQAIRRWDKTTLIFVMFVILFFLFLFFVMYFMLITKNLTADIGYISGSIAHMAFSEGAEKIEVRRQDEIGEIAGRINEMTEQINQLITSERDALQSNKDLIACVAHDLRTPITSVKGYLDLALDTKHYDLEQRQKYVRIAQTKANRLEYLIHDLFNYTKLTSGEITLHRSKIDLVQLVEQMMEEFYPLFQEEELECTTKYNISYLEMNMDGELIARAVQNLLSNAIKYGKDGKHVYVELECLEQEVQIRVTNYGLVIPEESIKHLFDKFYRVERSRNVKTGGTGLGLNIAQEIVHLHGGRIQVTSGASGTCFTIALPLHKEEEEE